MSPRIKNGNDLGFTSHVRTDGILLRPAQRVLRYIVQKSKDTVTSYKSLLTVQARSAPNIQFASDRLGLG